MVNLVEFGMGGDSRVVERQRSTNRPARDRADRRHRRQKGRRCGTKALSQIPHGAVQVRRPCTARPGASRRDGARDLHQVLPAGRRYDAGRGPVRGWLFTMAKSVASTSPGVPRPGLSCRSRTSSCRPSTTPLTRRSRCSPSIRPSTSCPRSTRRDAPGPRRLHPLRDRRAPGHPDRHRQIPDGQGGRHVAGRAGQPARVATMLSERDIELAHPEAFDFVFGNLPSAKRAEFNRHLSSCRYCQGVVDEYSDIGQIIKLLPASRRAASRPRGPNGRRDGRRPGRAAGRDRSPSRRRGPGRHPGLPDPPAPVCSSPRPRFTRGPSSRLRLRTSPGSTRSPRPSPRPIRRPSRRSLACLCGAVTLAGLLLS